jgi:adenosine deaminase
MNTTAEYADYHHAMAQHAAALSNSNQLHPAMAQIPMSQMLSAGLNLTVSSHNMIQNSVRVRPRLECIISLFFIITFYLIIY